MADEAISFILQGTDGISPVVDQGAAAVSRLDAAGQRAFTRLVSQTVAWQTSIAASERELQRLTTLQSNTVGAEKQEAIGRRIETVIDQQILAENRLITAEKQWAIATEEAAQRAQAAQTRAAAAYDASVSKQIADMQKLQAAGNTGGGNNFMMGLVQGIGQGVATQGLSLIKEGFEAIGTAAKEAAGFVVQATADQQGALVTYARQLGDVTKAYQEMAQVKGGAVLSSRELPEVISLDQTLLARFKSMEFVEQTAGRTFKAVRTDILDTAAALKLSDEQMQRIGIDLQEIQSGQNTGRALQSLNMITGITRDELAKQGVMFDAAGTHIVSSYDGAFRAVLTTMETRFGGMDALQSRTFNGMMSNVGDLARMFASELGEKGIGVATGYISRWIEGIVNNPNLIPTLQLWGDRIGRITEAGFQLLERMGDGAQRLYTVLRPVVALFGQWADSLPPASDGMSDLMAAAAKGGTQVTGAMQDAQNATDALATAQAGLEAQQKAMSRQIEDTRTAYDKLLNVQRDRATAIKRDEEDIRYAAEQELIPLKDKSTLLDRIYEQTHKETDLAKLQREIARDQALSKDQFSSEGRAAGLRLVGEEQQKADLLAAMAHTNEKNRLADSMTGVERKRDAALHADEVTQRSVEDRIHDLEREQAAAMLSYRAEQRQLEDRISAYKAYAAIQDTIFTAVGTVTTAIRGALGPTRETAGAVAEIGIKADGSAKQMDALDTRMETFGKGAAVLAASIGAMFGVAMIGMEQLAGHGLNAIDQAVTGSEIAALQLRDFFSGQNQDQDAELQNRLARLTRLQTEDKQIDTDAQRRIRDLGNSVNNAITPALPRTAGTVWNVQGGSTGSGADGFGNAGSGGSFVTAPARPPTSTPGPGVHVEIVMQEDADGKWHRVRQVVKDELGNTANSDTLARTLAPVLARAR